MKTGTNYFLLIFRVIWKDLFHGQFGHSEHPKVETTFAKHLSLWNAIFPIKMHPVHEVWSWRLLSLQGVPKKTLFSVWRAIEGTILIFVRKCLWKMRSKMPTPFEKRHDFGPSWRCFSLLLSQRKDKLIISFFLHKEAKSNQNYLMIAVKINGRKLQCFTALGQNKTLIILLIFNFKWPCRYFLVAKSRCTWSKGKHLQDCQQSCLFARGVGIFDLIFLRHFLAKMRSFCGHQTGNFLNFSKLTLLLSLVHSWCPLWPVKR